MRTPSLSLGTIGILAAGLIAPSLQAQTSSATPVIGYYKAAVPAGASAWTNGFVTKKEFQGQSTSIASAGSNAVITQTGASFGSFSGGYYVELLDDPNTPAVEAYAGLILDIVSNTGTTITVETDGQPVVGYGQNLRYCVRKHATLASVLPSAAGVQDFDGLTLYTTGQSNPEQAFVFDTGHWYVAAGANAGSLADSAVIYPGQGFIYTASGSQTLTIGGNQVSYVKEGQTQYPLVAGFPNLLGPINPLVGPSPTNPAVPNEFTLPAIGLQNALSDFDGVSLISTNGSATATDLVLDTGHFYYASGPNAGQLADALKVPVGGAFYATPNSDVSAVLPAVTVAP